VLDVRQLASCLSTRRAYLHLGRPIVVPGGSRQERHKALWELLVPSSGAGATVQCEAIRVTGRISDEMFRNGGANWALVIVRWPTRFRVPDAGRAFRRRGTP